MTKVYSYTQELQPHILDSFCVLQKGFTDQFVYYNKQRPFRYMGLGRCIALPSVAEIDCEMQGPAAQPPALFSFKRFDAENPNDANELFQTFPNLRFLLPELVLIENEQGRFLQVNSLGPVYKGRVERFAASAAQAPGRTRRSIPYTLTLDSRIDWDARVNAALEAIAQGRVDKVVPSRQIRLQAEEPFSSKDLLVNLIDGPAQGTVFMYRYGDVFFCGCTPELLVRKNDENIESMCLAGTAPLGHTAEEQQELAQQLLANEKERREHAFVVDFLKQVCLRNCYSVSIPHEPSVLPLATLQHLHTPVQAKAMAGRSIQSLAGQLHPTPALAGTPVGEALMLLREIEPYNRGFYGGSVGVVDAAGNGEFSVAIRSGVFDGQMGWLYAGCGIVPGSTADSEYEEINLKLKTILSAFSHEG